jgi:hypothetical protein
MSEIPQPRAEDSSYDAMAAAFEAAENDINSRPREQQPVPGSLYEQRLLPNGNRPEEHGFLPGEGSNSIKDIGVNSNTPDRSPGVAEIRVNRQGLNTTPLYSATVIENQGTYKTGYVGVDHNGENEPAAAAGNLLGNRVSISRPDGNDGEYKARLTGKNAERATEILAKRAARGIVQGIINKQVSL